MAAESVLQQVELSSVSMLDWLMAALNRLEATRRMSAAGPYPPPLVGPMQADAVAAPPLTLRDAVLCIRVPLHTANPLFISLTCRSP